jgi:hypothetical protein
MPDRMPAVDRRLGWGIAFVVLLPVLAALAMVWLPYLPNQAGHIGADYSVWLPTLLAGDFWHQQNGLFSVPWFNPAQCGGVPVQADPQGAYFSLPQFLSFVVPPLRAVQLSFFAYASIGYLGCFAFARLCLRLSVPAALLAAVLFAFNTLFAARMVVGHLAFAPIMLLPAAALCLIGHPPAGPARLTGWIIRCGCFGVLLALMLEGGMLVLLPPAYLSLAMVIALCAALAETPPLLPLLRLAVGTATGLLLGAGKLAAVLSLMGSIPRDAYPLPGYPHPLTTIWVAFRALFLGPAADMPAKLVNTVLWFEPHEFEYSIGPAPLALIVAALILAWRRRLRPTGRERLACEVLLLLLLVPLAANTYTSGWTGFLKHVPVIRSSSSLLRWFAAYMLPGVLAAGVALDRLAAARLLRPWPIMAASSAATLAVLLLSDRSVYGAGDIGAYDPRIIEAAWHDAASTGQVPPVTEIAVTRDAHGAVDKMSLTRQDGMATGQSQLFCYDPLFGYHLENFPQGTLHPGSVFDRTGTPAQLNIKNPACYVFPGANACKPGDAFAASDIDRARLFVSYKAFPWNKPVWAKMADWVGYCAWPLTVMALCMAIWTRRRHAALPN